MASAQLRPVLDRTFYTQRHVLGLGFLLGGFALLLGLYHLVGVWQALRAEAARSAAVAVQMPCYQAALPEGWAYYTRRGDSLTLVARESEGGALLALDAVVSGEDRYRYRALDTNPAFVVRKLAKSYAAHFGVERTFDILGIDSVPFLPGIPSVRFWFSVDNPSRQGRACLFYVDNTQYLFWGLMGEGDPDGRVLERYLSGSSGAVVLPESSGDRYARPVIHSGKITYAQSRAASEEAERELAQAQAHAARIKLAGSAHAMDLVPALDHFRKAVRLLSSIRREDRIVRTEVEARFAELEALRRRQVKGWFDAVDCALAMRDIEAARAQLEQLIASLILEGEADDRLRAQLLLGHLPAAPKKS